MVEQDLSLFHFQGTSRTSLMVEHCTSNTLTGKQFWICIEDLVLEIGLFSSLWQMPFPTIAKWVSHHSWVYHICEFNYENEILINLEHAELKPKRDGDKAIMWLATLYSDKRGILKAINPVQMFHGVACLSDITTADSSRINEEFLYDRDQFDGRRNDFLWLVKHDGNNSNWLEWWKFMEFVYTGGNFSFGHTITYMEP